MDRIRKLENQRKIDMKSIWGVSVQFLIFVRELYLYTVYEYEDDWYTRLVFGASLGVMLREYRAFTEIVPGIIDEYDGVEYDIC